MGVPLAELQRDILDLASCIYLADRHTQRQSGTGAARMLRILIALRQPESQDPTALSTLLRNLSSDYVSFALVKRRVRDETAQTDKTPVQYANDSVCLLSGGVDSFGGAIEACEKGLSPAILGHYTSDSKPQKQLAGSISHHYRRDREGDWRPGPSNHRCA